MGMARVQVAVAYLLDRLPLPAEAKVLQADMGIDGRDVVFTVEHADIRTADGPLQTIWPTLQREANGAVKFENWGQK